MKAELPTEPVFFMKPDTALLRDADFYLPDFTSDLQHEIELVLRISKAGKHIEEQFANKYYDAIGLGIDFTARDLQAKLKEKGYTLVPLRIFMNSKNLAKIEIGLAKGKSAAAQQAALARTQNGDLRCIPGLKPASGAAALRAGRPARRLFNLAFAS